jgi:hypothetical protein
MHDLVSAHACFTSTFDPLDEPIEFRTTIPGRRGTYVFSGKYEKWTQAVRAATLRNKYDSMLLLYTADGGDTCGGGSPPLVFTDEQGKQRALDPSNAHVDTFYSVHSDTRFSSIDEWITTINAHFSLHRAIDRAMYDGIYFPHYDAKQSIGAHIRQLGKRHSAMKRLHATPGALAAPGVALEVAPEAAPEAAPPTKKPRLQQAKPAAPALVDALFTHVEHIHALCAGGPLTDDTLRQVAEAANAAKTLLVCAHPKLIKRIAIDVDEEDAAEADGGEESRAIRLENDDSDSDDAFWAS